MPDLTVDAEGLALAWVKAYPGLVGVGMPLIGMHLTDDARSPGKGVIGSLAVTGLREVDMEGLGDSARLSFKVEGIGGESSGKRQTERAARALANAVRTLTGVPVVVSTPDGETARISHAHTVYGPTWLGAPAGRPTYRVDATFVFQV